MYCIVLFIYNLSRRKYQVPYDYHAKLFIYFLQGISVRITYTRKRCMTSNEQKRNEEKKIKQRRRTRSLSDCGIYFTRWPLDNKIWSLAPPSHQSGFITVKTNGPVIYITVEAVADLLRVMFPWRWTKTIPIRLSLSLTNLEQYTRTRAHVHIHTFTGELL